MSNLTPEGIGEMPETTKYKINLGKALMHIEKLLNFYENDVETSFMDLMFLRKLRSNLQSRDLRSKISQ